jgi:NADH dehydrogenase
VIVGAGFGGLWAARALAGSDADVLVLDRNNYHTFHALLYQVATGELEPEEISYPVRSILRKMPNVRFGMAEVYKVDLVSRAVETSNGPIYYEFLILATGSTTQFFDVPGATEHAFELKTLDQAIGLRNHILCCLEAATGETDAERRDRLLTFAIVGGGATGVEFAGALCELIRGPIAKDYPMLGRREIKVMLLEAGDSLLPPFGERLRNYTQRRLSKMGVGVRFGAKATAVGRDGVHLDDGVFVPTETVVWTGGVRGGPVAEASGFPITEDGRVRVSPTLQVPGHPEAYVVGDLAYTEEKDQPLPFVAQVAMQGGKAAARNIVRQMSGREPVAFKYRDKGAMATIGRKAAVARLGKREFTGFPAWLLWVGVHIFKLIGFRNRLIVLVNWAWDFVLYERGVRLILPSETCSALRSRAVVESDGEEDSE